MLCQSRLHCVFASVACILIGKDEKYGNTHAIFLDFYFNDHICFKQFLIQTIITLISWYASGNIWRYKLLLFFDSEDYGEVCNFCASK